jgi:hypothetical protein
MPLLRCRIWSITETSLWVLSHLFASKLSSYHHMQAYLDLWKPQIAAAKSVGKEFIVGEYSSISCSGKENVSDTFGQAMWLADCENPPFDAPLGSHAH